MYLKTAEIIVNKNTLVNIIENWKQVEGVDKSNELLDNAKLLNFTLRVPFKTKGGMSHTHIESRLEVIEGSRFFKLIVQCNVMKPILITFLIFVFGVFLLWSVKQHLAIVFLVPIALALMFVISTFSSINKRSEDFLKQLKHKYFIH